ncbi:hypothetical protein ANCDUO_16563 [Ancylostoma duodenale]|uniref:Uncharacterized protein n=1 Tax=Ancylostoma duodenale TaxID=51022 RepID=A0A0C2CU37_9BILA|nr:hypothetical protein ANCDUO_16563 [Ancylostoma duodenale]
MKKKEKADCGMGPECGPTCRSDVRPLYDLWSEGRPLVSFQRRFGESMLRTDGSEAEGISTVLYAVYTTSIMTGRSRVKKILFPNVV